MAEHTEFTPTTGAVRRMYALGVNTALDHLDDREPLAEFDRWLGKAITNTMDAARLQDKIDSQERIIEMLRNDLDLARERAGRLGARKRELQQRNETLTTERDRLVVDLDRTAEAADRDAVRLREVERERDDWKRRAEAPLIDHKRCEALRADRDAAQAALDIAQRQVAFQQRNLSTVRAQRDAWKARAARDRLRAEAVPAAALHRVVIGGSPERVADLETLLKTVEAQRDRWKTAYEHEVAYHHNHKEP